MDAFQINNTTFGANINFTPAIEKYVKLTKGVFKSMIIYLTDQNKNPNFKILIMKKIDYIQKQ